MHRTFTLTFLSFFFFLYYVHSHIRMYDISSLRTYSLSLLSTLNFQLASIREKFHCHNKVFTRNEINLCLSSSTLHFVHSLFYRIFTSEGTVKAKDTPKCALLRFVLRYSRVDNAKGRFTVFVILHFYLLVRK